MVPVVESANDTLATDETRQNMIKRLAKSVIGCCCNEYFKSGVTRRPHREMNLTSQIVILQTALGINTHASTCTCDSDRRSEISDRMSYEVLKEAVEEAVVEETLTEEPTKES